MKRFAAFLTACALISAYSADAATVATNRGFTSGLTINSTPGGAFTLGSTPAAGEMLSVGIQATALSTAITCEDNIGGATGWVTIPRFLSGTVGYLIECHNLSVPAGVTTVFIKNPVSDTVYAVAGSYTNVTGRDASGDDAGAFSSTPALSGTTTSGSLANASELLVLVSGYGNNFLTTYAPGSGETLLAHGVAGSTWLATMAYIVTSSASPFVWNASWTPTNTWGMKVYAFTISAAAATNCTLTTTGAGAC